MQRLPALLELYERDGSFCGRGADLRALEDAWRRARDSPTMRLALLGGEPGAGKTRLLARLASRVGEGAPVLYGRCREEPGGAYEPLMEALDAAAPAQDGAGARLAAITHLADPAQGQRKGFELGAAILDRLRELSAAGPVLLLVDDLQWVDRETLRLLTDALEAEAGTRGLAILAFRDADVDEGQVAPGLHRLRRRPGTTEWSLSGLLQPDLEELAASMAQRVGLDLDTTLVRDLGAETGGNALFATELLRDLIEREEAGDGAPAQRIPTSVTETIRQRIARLGGDVEEALTVAAVCGAEFDVALLDEVLGWEPGRLERCLRDAERAKLLQGRRPGTLAFSHALVARSLTERAGGAHRQAIHRAIAEALERMPGYRERETEALARHWLAASPPDHARASEYAREAGRRALAGHRIDAACDLFRSALALDDPAADDSGRAELLLGLGLAQRQAADPGFGRTLLEASKAAARAGEAAILNSSLIAAGRDFDNALRRANPERIELLRAAIEVADESDRAYPLLLATLASELTYSGEERFDISDRAVEAARRLGDEEALAWVLVRRFVTIWTPDTLDERLSNAAKAVALADRSGDPTLQFHAVHWSAVAHLERGDFSRGIELFERESAIARRFGHPVFRFISAFDRANLAILRDEVERADELAAEAFQLANDIAFPGAIPYYASQVCNIRYQQGRLGELRDLLRQVVTDHPRLESFLPILALACVEAGRDEEAREVLAEQAQQGLDRRLRDLTWLPGMVVTAHVSADLGEREGAAQLRDLLDPYAGRPALTGGSTLGEVDHALGRLAALLGNEDASALLERASARYEEVGASVWQARARTHLAELRLSQGRTEEARTLLELAVTAATRAGGAGAARRAEAILAGLGERRVTEPQRHDAARMRAEGDAWVLSRDGTETRIRRSVGMEYLAQLVARPGIEISAVRLQGGPDADSESEVEQARLNVTRAIRRAISAIAKHDAALAADLDRSIRTGSLCAYEPAGADPLVHVEEQMPGGWAD